MWRLLKLRGGWSTVVVDNDSDVEDINDEDNGDFFFLSSVLFSTIKFHIWIHFSLK